MPRGGAQDGQATVELIALLPCVAALLAGLWQAVLMAHAQWAATAAARAAARAQAVGADPERAARAHLEPWLEPGLRVGARAGGEVRIAVRIPGLPGLPSIGHARAAARFEPQS
jgi:TadE-like protein